jgi:membrane protein
VASPGSSRYRRLSARCSRLWTTANDRLEHWRQSAPVRHLRGADVVNRGMLFAAVLLLCFVPFLLVLQSLAGRTQASGFIRRFGLTGQAAHAVRQALTSPTGTSAAINGVSWVFFILGGIAAAAAIQELYERVFGAQRRGFRNTPQRVIWLAVGIGAIFLEAWAYPGLNDAGGPVLVAIASAIGATGFWWFSMWLLLARKLTWRALFPSALATGICWLGMSIFFRLTISSAITSDYRKYGSIGVVFVLMTLLIAIGVVIALGAVLGVVWRERGKTRTRLTCATVRPQSCALRRIAHRCRPATSGPDPGLHAT